MTPRYVVIDRLKEASVSMEEDANVKAVKSEKLWARHDLRPENDCQQNRVSEEHSNDATAHACAAVMGFQKLRGQLRTKKVDYVAKAAKEVLDCVARGPDDPSACTATCHHHRVIWEGKGKRTPK